MTNAEVKALLNEGFNFNTVVDYVTFPYKKFSYDYRNIFFNILQERFSYIALREVNSDGTIICYFNEGQKDKKYRDYHQINVITDIFTEEERLKAINRNKNNKQSPLEYYRQNFHDIICRIIEKDLDVNCFTLREQLYMEIPEAHQFKVTLAFSLIRIFKPKSMLDPRVLWGDRLVAAIACKVQRFIGFEKNKRLEMGHKMIIGSLSSLNSLNIEKYHIDYKTDFTKLNFDINLDPNFDLMNFEDLDLVFTSIHEYDTEEYPSEKFNSYQEWYHYYEKLIKNCIKCVRTKGHIIIEIYEEIMSKYKNIDDDEDSEIKDVTSRKDQILLRYKTDEIAKKHGASLIQTIHTRKSNVVVRVYRKN